MLIAYANIITYNNIYIYILGIHYIEHISIIYRLFIRNVIAIYRTSIELPISSIYQKAIVSYVDCVDAAAAAAQLLLWLPSRVVRNGSRTATGLTPPLLLLQLLLLLEGRWYRVRV